MCTLIELAPTLAVFLVAAGVIMYMVAILVAAFGPTLSGSISERLRAWFISAPAQNIGLPCAALASFSIVALSLRAFPPADDGSGLLTLKAFGLEFSGLSGPITLWLMCFLAFVIALRS
jgi:hypothetical protein